ncbi:MAG: hypothetical protein DWI54_05830 [Chloroflexi bacterium]|nr:MAG: hypothetical protein DWI54_05830 [Chloroflexota bacterium]RLT32569.1 MAG: hypothetical protein DWI55_04445 [Chloroflexota bacterium]
MTTQYEIIALHGLPILITLFALWQISGLAGRRSPRREGLANAGMIGIIIGLMAKTYLQIQFSTALGLDVPSPYATYPILAAGYILLMFGFVGWDRMLLSRPGWTMPIILIILVEAATFVSARLGMVQWWMIPFAVVIGSMMLIDLLFLGFALRQRLTIAVPFLLLHIASVIVTTAIELKAPTDAGLLNGILLSTITSAVLFVISTRLITKHTGRGRMMVV